jgi:flagellar hook-basal body complex protein FliE
MAVGGVAAAAAAAYRAAAGAVGPLPAEGFGGLVQRAMEQGVQVGRSAEAASTAAMLGQGGVTEAVLAISRAELALQTTVAVRDRVVAAYQEIMRMPIRSARRHGGPGWPGRSLPRRCGRRSGSRCR